MGGSAVVTAAAASFTGAGVLLALWLQVLRPALRHPQLTMSYVRESDDLGHIQSDDSTWLRFRVANATGKDTAENVEVLLVSATDLEHEKPKGEEPFPRRRLKWADAGGELVDLHAGVYRYIDVGFIRPRARDVFVFRFSPPALDEDTLIGRHGEDSRYWIERPGNYRFLFVVSAVRVNARLFSADIELRHHTADGMVRLGVSVPGAPVPVEQLPE